MIQLRTTSIFESNSRVGDPLFCRQTFHGIPGSMSGNLQPVQSRSQQLPGPTQVIIVINSSSFLLLLFFLFYDTFRALFLISDSLLCLKQDIKCEMNSMMNPRATVPEGSLIGLHGIDQKCPLNPVVCVYFLILLCSFYRFYDFTALVFFFPFNK
jgi:hypothetical protein